MDTPTKLNSRTTLCFLIDNSHVLLAMKKRGFGVGKWNGTGGKIEEGESIEQAAVRETREEIGATPRLLEKVAVLTFHFAEEVAKLGKSEECIVFICKQWDGEPIETEEMKPKWFEKTKLPFEIMWDDDPIWLPLVLKGEKVNGEFWFDRNFKMTDHNVKVVKNLL